MNAKTPLAAALVWARLALPLATGIIYTVSALFYNISALQTGVRLKISAARLLGNTLVACRRYLASGHTAPQSRYYGWLAALALLAGLCFLLALAASALMLWCAARAFGKDAAKAKRAKTVFKILFPNRVWLFLCSCLWLVPALYPHGFSLIGQKNALAAPEPPVFITFNLPLVLVLVGTGLTLALALLAPRAARRTGHDLFLKDV